MFRFTKKPPSGSHSQYLAKITSLVQCRYRRRTDVVSAMAAYYAAIALTTSVRLILIYGLFLGACAKLRKPTISFVMSVCPHGTNRYPLDGFS